MWAGKTFAAVGVVVLVAGACSSGGDSEDAVERSRTAPESSGQESGQVATAPDDPAAAEAEIGANFTKYFDSETPQDEAFALAEGVDAIKDTLLASQAASPGGHRTVGISKVEFTSATEAVVTFDILYDGNGLLLDSTGKVVLDDGVWKVSRELNCALTALAGFSCPE